MLTIFSTIFYPIYIIFLNHKMLHAGSPFGDFFFLILQKLSKSAGQYISFGDYITAHTLKMP